MAGEIGSPKKSTSEEDRGEHINIDTGAAKRICSDCRSNAQKFIMYGLRKTLAIGQNQKDL